MESYSGGLGVDVERSKILELPGRLNHEEIGTPLSDSAPYNTQCCAEM